MNKLCLIGYENQVAEIVCSNLTLSKLQKLVEVYEIETVGTKPLSFRVIADKYLVSWLNKDYKQLK